MDSDRSPTFRRNDLLMVAGVAFAGFCIATSLVQSSRARSRRVVCVNNMRQLGVALQAYLDAHQTLPYAARWTSEGLDVRKVDEEPWTGHAVRENWAQLLLPHLGENALSDSFDRSSPITGPENSAARTAELGVLRCPDDGFSVKSNMFRYDDPNGVRADFARGNYAINGGTQAIGRMPGTSSSPAIEGHGYAFDERAGDFQWWGNGVAGINKAFGPRDFKNGLSTLVALNEVRAGIHPVDSRGAWAMGQIGSSITFSHGVTGDDYGPNNQGDRADDVLGCDRLRKLLGDETLKREKMPCCWYASVPIQATSRSLHAGGVNTLMMDGAVRFIPDSVDPGLWHVMHSRETPPGEIEPRILEDPQVPSPVMDQRDPVPISPIVAKSDSRALPPRIVNSIEMDLNLIPAGEFTMGVPDAGFEDDVPPETPPHQVRITSPFYIGTYEVTQAQYEAVMGANPSWHTSARAFRHLPPQDTKVMPVEQVSWEEAVEFCRRLSERPREKERGLTYRLPTEAEWEYACRSGLSAPYEWKAKADSRTGENAGYLKKSPLDTASVGSYPPNEFGLYDMRGNVYEWCADWFARDYYGRSPVLDPPGPDRGYLRVVRGGDWLFAGEGCMINRRVTSPWLSNRYLGFRVALDRPVDTTTLPTAPGLAGNVPTLAVFCSHRDPRRNELVRLDLVRGTAVVLKSGWSVSPTWSPDGHRLAYSFDKKDLEVCDADGAENTNLTKGTFRLVKAPTWSPDGRRLAFFATRDNSSWTIYVINSDGSGLRPLVERTGSMPMPAWSPDGARVLYASGVKAGKFALFSAAVADGTVRMVREDVPYLAAPAWSPDGDRFVFSDKGEAPEALRLAIATARGEKVATISPGGYDVFPAWSPDGRSIAYVHFDDRKDARGDLMVYDADSGATRVVSRGILLYGEHARPSWRPATKPPTLQSRGDSSHGGNP